MNNYLHAQITPEWVNTYSFTKTHTTASDIIHDAEGNIYMGATSSGAFQRYDVIKYNSAGIEQWMHRFNGGNTYETTQNIAIDNDGNIVVLHNVDGYYLHVSKLDSDNNILWEYIYDDDNFGSFGNAINIDVNGNIYVCGWRSNAASNQRSLSIKIDPNGNQLWEAIFDLNGSNADNLYSIKADIDGNVWICGSGYRNAIQYQNIVVLKYNSTGIFQWSKEINGTGNGNDIGWYIFPDNVGNAFVTGELYTASQATNIYTIKLNNSGTTLWSNEFNGTANSNDYIVQATMDSSGNFIITGDGYSSTNNYNIVTRKFQPDGTISWTNEYNTNAAGTNIETASAVIADSFGNIYVSGRDQSAGGYYRSVLIKYDSVGTELFSSLISEASITTNPSYRIDLVNGNILMPDTETDGTFEARIRCYTTENVFNFTTNYIAGAYTDDIIYGMQCDVNGNTNFTTIVGNVLEKFVKVDNAGNILWNTDYSGNDYVLTQGATFLDESGNYYVCGGRAAASGYYAMAATKISAAGTILWTSTYNAPGNGHDYATNIYVDASGNTYITGYGYAGASKGHNIYTVKFNSAGVQQWASELEGVGSTIEAGENVIADADGNVYICGNITTSANQTNFMVAKYNITGTLLWSYQKDGDVAEGSEYDRENAWNLTLDEVGNVYACGRFHNIYPNYQDIYVVKLNTSGVEQWSYTKSGSGNWIDEVYNIKWANNQLCVSGYVYELPDNTKSYLCVLNGDGSVVMENNYEIDIDDGYTEGFGNMNIDEWGNIVSTVSYGAETNVFKIDPLGNIIWVYSSPSNFGPSYTLISENGGIFTADNVLSNSQGNDVRIMKICDPKTPEILTDGPTTFCEGEDVILTSSPASGYLWSTGETTQSIIVNTSGYYSVLNTFTNGCSISSDPISITVNPNPVNTVTIIGATTFCAGGSANLSADEIGAMYLWNNGETTQIINVTTEGNYNLTVTNGYGCSATSETINVIVNPIPLNTVSISGATTFCEGGFTNLIADETDALYLWSNGEINQSITVATTGNYSVVITNAYGCSSTSAIIPVTVNSNPVATITPSGPTTFCTGSNVVLDAGAGFTSYLWSNGSTAQFIIVNTTSTYNVTVTNGFGCMDVSENIPVTVNPTTTASISASGATTFCQGGNVVLTVTHNGTAVQWKKNGVIIVGATGANYTANQTGNYTCTVTGSCGTPTSNTITVTANKNPKATITAGGATTFCAGGSVVLNAVAGGGQSYQWYKGNAIIAGATTTSYTATTAGNYKCKVTKNATGCSKFSNVIIVTVPCRSEELSENEMTVSPNPTSGLITIIFTNHFAKDETIRLLDITGQLIFTKIIKAGESQTIIDLSAQAAGMYVLQFERETGIQTKKIVKQ